MTRRELAALLVAAPAMAQTAAAPEPAPPPAQPNDQIAAAKDDLRQAATQLAKAKLNVTTEPAFRFKA
jgi:hypothetical protein